MNIGLKITQITITLLALFLSILYQPPVYGQGTTTFSPTRNSQLEVRNDLLDKSQNQKVWAWVLMGVGVPVLSVGWIGGAIGGNAGPALVGLGMVIGSITLFIASSKNQTRALKMYIGFLPLPGFHQNVVQKSFSSESLILSKSLPGIQFTYTF